LSRRIFENGFWFFSLGNSADATEDLRRARVEHGKVLRGLVRVRLLPIELVELRESWRAWQ
jgi:hypothetical protein